MRTVVALFMLLVILPSGFADTLYVPAQFPFIQTAINAANKNDTILVSPGIYMESIDFMGKTVAVKSELGPDVTIIDGNQSKYAAAFQNGEGLLAQLEGFTITNGQKFGVYCQLTSPTLINNIISANSDSGVYCYNSHSIQVTGNRIQGNGSHGISCNYSDGVRIEDNHVFNNQYHGILCKNSHAAHLSQNRIYGNHKCGVYVWFSDGTRISRNRILANEDKGVTCRNSFGTELANNIIAKNKEEGIYLWYADSPYIETATIVGNNGIGVYCRDSQYMILVNSIVWKNKDKQIWVHPSGSMASVTYCNVQKGYKGVGNISFIPHFADENSNDFHLTYTCPSRDAGDNNSLIEPFDFEIDPRISNGIVDMGADEFHTHLYFTGNAAPNGKVAIKFIDFPNLSPVFIWLGSGVFDPPLNLPLHGEWYLKFPLVFQANLGSIPSPEGVLVLNGVIPSNMPAPIGLPFQAGIGLKLTNLMELKIH